MSRYYRISYSKQMSRRHASTGRRSVVAENLVGAVGLAIKKSGLCSPAVRYTIDSAMVYNHDTGEWDPIQSDALYDAVMFAKSGGQA